MNKIFTEEHEKELNKFIDYLKQQKLVPARAVQATKTLDAIEALIAEVKALEMNLRHHGDGT